MFVVGLTGGIATGKSTVGKTLQELGAIIINSDNIAHQVVEPGQPAWQAIVDAFGEGILNEDKTINRPKLGHCVFSQPEMLHRLNEITHPPIMAVIRDRIHTIREENPHAIVVMEVPLLYETHMDKLCDQVWVVWVDQEIQITRLMARDSISRQEAERRIAAQMPLEEKVKRAQVVIDNSRSLQETRQMVTRYFNEIKPVVQ